MKYRVVTVLFLIIILTTIASANPQEFSKQQSYELADLILSFIPDVDAKEPYLSWEIGKSIMYPGS